MLPRCQDNLTERHSDFSGSILLIFDKIRSYYQYILSDIMESNEERTQKQICSPLYFDLQAGLLTHKHVLEPTLAESKQTMKHEPPSIANRQGI